MFKLPTSANRRNYRGKYPDRINSWSYSKSPAQQALGQFLGIKRPVHMELNCGDRLIADISEVKANEFKLGMELEIILAHVPTVLVFLSDKRYSEMLLVVQTARDAA